MKKKRTPVRQRDVWTPNGRHQKQVTLFRMQVKDKELPDPEPFDGKPKKRRARKKFLLKEGKGSEPSENYSKE